MFWKRKMVLGVLALVFTGSSVQADFLLEQPVHMSMIDYSTGNELIRASSLSPDGLSLCLYGGEGRRTLGQGDLWVMKRKSIHDSWGDPTLLDTPISTDRLDKCACITADGLELFFSSYRGGGCGNEDIWVAKRATCEDSWGCPVNLGTTVNTCAAECMGSVSADGLELYFVTMGKRVRDRACGGADIWMITRASREDAWSEPMNLGVPVNSPAAEQYPCISTNGLMLLFASDRSGNIGGLDMWVSTRPTQADVWGEPKYLGDQVNTEGLDFPAGFSSAESTLYFNSECLYPDSLIEVHQAQVRPVLDFDQNGSVDLKDIQDLLAQWGTNHSLYDIGPTPFGDGLVDEKDLSVLVEHMIAD